MPEHSLTAPVAESIADRDPDGIAVDPTAPAAVAVPTTVAPAEAISAVPIAAALGAAPSRRRGLGRRSTYFLFIVPALAVYLLMVIVPSLQTLQLSLTDWDGISPSYNYVGMANYSDMLGSQRFWTSVRNTLLLGFGSAIIINIISLAVALMLDQVRHFSGFFRTIVYMPALVSGFIFATIWKYVLNYNFGFVNSLLRPFGLDQNWLGDPKLVVWVLLFILCFTLGGNTTLIYLANLQSVPQELVDAARVDGAGSLSVFRNVTWPMIAGSLTINMTLAMIGGWTIFDQIQVLTTGGPGFVSETMAFFIYKVGFGEYRAGYGSAAAVLLFLIIFVTTSLGNAYMRRREVQA